MGEQPCQIPHPPLFHAASAYVAAGLSVLPISTDGEKRPYASLLPVCGTWPDGRERRGWTPLRERLPTADELQCWYSGWNPPGIAVVCGAISGGLEAIDIDSEEYGALWITRLAQTYPELIHQLVFVQTPRPGVHCYFRCASPEGNQKLARIYPASLPGEPPKATTIIETRGEGGYVTTPPTPGYCHPTGRPYQYMNERTLVDVVTLSMEERNLLIQTACSFDTRPVRAPQPARRNSTAPRSNGDRPGDYFNARANWTELLQRHHSTWSHEESDGTQYWIRPGKTHGSSATVNYSGSDRLFVFTSNAAPLEAEESYDKFSFVALMEYEGNFQAAARALAAEGYRSRNPFPNQPCGRKRHRPRRRGEGRQRTRNRT